MMSIPTIVFVILMLAVPAWFAVTAMGFGRWRLTDRVGVGTQAVNCLALLVIGRLVLPWQDLPVAIWGLAAALTAFAVLVSASAIRRLPVTRPGARPSVRIAGGAVNAVVGLAIAAVFLA